MKNPKQKGSSFERKICKELSLWVSLGERDNLFWRSAISGGRATVRHKKGLDVRNQLGDITSIDTWGDALTDNFIIECKHYKDLEWSQFVYGKGFIWATWKKLRGECHDHGRQPFLILKQNAKPVLVALSYKTVGRLKDHYHIRPFLEASEFGLYDFEHLMQFTDLNGWLKD
jgi:hypothetical protein